MINCSDSFFEGWDEISIQNSCHQNEISVWSFELFFGQNGNLRKFNKEMNSISAFVVANIDRCDRYSTNRFHVVERRFSNRSQLTSKCGKNWDVAHSPTACGRFYYIFTSSVIYCSTDPKQNGMNLFYTMIREEKIPIHIPAKYPLAVWGFELV